MKFATDRRWWTRTAAYNTRSLEGRWLPLVGLGGLLVALLFTAWRYEPAADAARTLAAAPAADGQTDFHQLPAVRVRLRADASGHLAAIALNGQPVRDAAELRERIKAFRGTATDATVEAELDCDGNLRYGDTQRTVAAISAYPSADGRTTMPLVDRVKFLPRRR